MKANCLSSMNKSTNKSKRVNRETLPLLFVRKNSQRTHPSVGGLNLCLHPSVYGLSSLLGFVQRHGSLVC